MLYEGMQRAVESMSYLVKVQEIMTNNLANASTTGYRQDVTVVGNFGDLLQKNMKSIELTGMDNSAEVVVNDNPTLAIKQKTSFAKGNLARTDIEFDFALDGNGFFVVSTPNGVRYTRNGSFTVDSEGVLKTKDGAVVLGQKGPIKIQGAKFEVKEDGSVFVNNQVVDKLMVVDFQDYGALVKEGATYFKLSRDVQPVEPNTRVLQGFLETSNVNPIKEMVNMVNVLRSFEMSQKVLQSQDEQMKKHIEQVSRMR
ncbi:MAG: flagellar hook-basal body protein [Candidatus Calescibacterium sp.]|nr:flagellar hook-basal body protein [Candidatus Calescibacterium sp.]MCX7758263.1 flagellar hook-basal body protein [bacterium]